MNNDNATNQPEQSTYVIGNTDPQDSATNQPQAGQNPWALRKPTWDAWKSIKQAKLWEAVALACDLDPSNFKIRGEPVLQFIGQLPEPMNELLDMAKANIGTGGILKLVSKSAHGLRDSEVKLSNFATWLKTVPHTPPPEFPWLPEAITLSNMNWPWGRHETDLLRKLAAAADHFWTLYEPGEPSTAPTNQMVIGWLKEQGVPSRTAEVMATILRADGLPSGPRK
jgi:hypothetical protein